MKSLSYSRRTSLKYDKEKYERNTQNGWTLLEGNSRSEFRYHNYHHMHAVSNAPYVAGIL